MMNCHQLKCRSLFFVVLLLGFINLPSNAQEQPSQDQDKLQLTAVNEPISVQDQYDPEHLFPKSTPIQTRAFQDITKQAMPMNPTQIVRLKKMLSVTQRAAAAATGLPPKPTLSTQTVNLSPGSIPPVIRLQQGFVTSVVFVDSTGADWPIATYDLGNSQAFNIQWKPGTNIIMLQAISMYTYGNLAVTLKGLPTPIMLTLVPGQQVVDYRVDLRVQQRGPQASPTYISQMPGTASSILTNVLDGITPQGAKVLDVTGDDCAAWLLGDRIYLRTRLTVLSPAWIAVVSSPDGTKAYEMEKSSTVLVSRYGKPVELKIEGL